MSFRLCIRHALLLQAAIFSLVQPIRAGQIKLGDALTVILSDDHPNEPNRIGQYTYASRLAIKELANSLFISENAAAEIQAIYPDRKLVVIINKDFEVLSSPRKDWLLSLKVLAQELEEYSSSLAAENSQAISRFSGGLSNFNSSKLDGEPHFPSRRMDPVIRLIDSMLADAQIKSHLCLNLF